MVALSVAASALAVAVAVRGAALPQSTASQGDAPSCLDKAQGTTFQWPTNTEGASGIFVVTCGTDYWGGDLRSFQADSFQSCLEACKAEPECVSVAYGGTSCYLKNRLTSGQLNGGIWSAKKTRTNKGLTCDMRGRFHTVVTANDAAQVWTAVRVDAQPFVYGLTCENNKDDNKTYKAKNGGSYNIECGVDYWGGDLSSMQTSTFEACMDACDAATGCIDVSYSSGTCYKKSVLNTASSAAWVWTGRKSVSTEPAETPLDLTQTELYSISRPGDTHITKEKNLFTQTLTGTNPRYGISTVLRFPTIPYTVYEISFEYYQEVTQGQSYFLEVGDSNGYLATLGWSQNSVGSAVQISPSYGNALGWTPASYQVINCWNTKAEPKTAPASGSWQTGKVVLYPRTTQGYFRRDNYGIGTTQWRNVYVRQKTSDYCGITQ
ncbi:hypothetical protein E8E12_008185 [Didymella heteroderae]|uniref:Apple domain-containing protein n=1 Tax=Didymella heteroderae TaxID=1769908 RepID=A0A9P4WXE2_9PLEO|nr:hypothetical protein E8E12_008185 [Didymella heteroderae]